MKQSWWGTRWKIYFFSFNKFSDFMKTKHSTKQTIKKTDTNSNRNSLEPTTITAAEAAVSPQKNNRNAHYFICLHVFLCVCACMREKKSARETVLLLKMHLSDWNKTICAAHTHVKSNVNVLHVCVPINQIDGKEIGKKRWFTICLY